MRRIALLALLVSACHEVTVAVSNREPTATIISPTAAQALVEARQVDLSGTAGDADDPLSTLRVSWLVDGMELCQGRADEDGGTSCQWTAEAGGHELSLAVTDPEGEVAIDRVELEVIDDQPPVATLIRPVEGDSFGPADRVVIAGVVSDPDDVPSALTVRVLSDVAGVLGTPIPDVSGRVDLDVALGAGRHTVILEVTDRLRQTGRATALVDVLGADAPPTCSVSAPARVRTGEAVALVGTVDDDLTARAAMTVSWTSDRDGPLGTTPVASDGSVGLSPVLSDGIHHVTLSVADGLGQPCADTATVVVDAAPDVVISAPTAGEVVAPGAALSVVALVSDAEDPPAALSVVVRSTLDGLLAITSPGGDGVVSVTRTDLQGGNHRFTVVVTDTAGNQVETSVDARVDRAPDAPEVIIQPAAPGTDDVLTAVIVTEAADPDGDALSYVWRWLRDGVVQAPIGPEVGAIETKRGEVWTVEVRADDGVVEGPAGTASVSIGNTPPTVASAEVRPLAPRSTDRLSCAATGLADADGDAVSPWVTWLADGGAVTLAGGGPAAGHGLELPAGSLRRGQVVSCEIEPWDGRELGPGVRSADVVLGNGLPEVAGASILPPAPVTGDALRCEALGFTDPDGDADLSRVDWLVDGGGAGSGPSLPGTAWRGQEVTCEVTAFDGYEEGGDAVITVTVGNAPPTATGARLEPEVPHAADVIRCEVVGFGDLEGDADQTAYAWFVDGIGAGAGQVLGADVVAGQVVRCEATPFDGHDAGATVAVEGVVGNSPPVITSARVLPAGPTVADALICEVTSVDADGDAVTVAVAWELDGGLAATGPELAAGVARRGQSVRCLATPDDGVDVGDIRASEAVIVANSPPRLVGLHLEPAAPTPGEAVRCVSEGETDADGDPVSVDLAWSVDGVGVGSGELLPVPTLRGQRLVCLGTPGDGLDDGETLVAEAVVGNGAPTAAAALIDPPDPDRTSTLTCVAVGYSDPDGDPDRSRVAWDVGGVPVGGGSLAGVFVRGDVVGCTLTVSDGTADGPVLGAAVEIGNAPPSVARAEISPSLPTGSDALLCLPSGLADPDGDAVDAAVRWLVDGVDAGTGPTLAAGVAARGQAVICEVTPRDAVEDGLPVRSDPVVIGNEAPSIGSVWIDPDPPRAGDAPACGWSGFVDVEGDADLSRLRWTVDGVDRGGVNPLVAPLSRGQVVGCTVTPSDGIDDGASLSTRVTVANSPPAAVGLRIVPEAPVRGDAPTCVVDGAADADGDPLSVALVWTVNGVDAGPGPTLTADLARGDALRCTAAISDGIDALVLVAEATVGNAPPQVVDGAITPDPLYTDDVAQLAVSAVDPDGDAVSLQVQWRVDGVIVGSGVSLSGAFFDRGEVVSAVVVPGDGLGSGAPWVSEGVPVVDSPPDAPVVTILPAEPWAGDELRCVVAPSVDPDGDPVTLDIAWSGPEGAVAGGTTVLPGDTVVATAGTWTCSVLPLAAGVEGPVGQASVVVQSLFPSTDVELRAAGVQVHGAAFETVGDASCPVVAANLDGDGLDDLVVGVPESDTVGTDSGGVFIFFGSTLALGGDFGTVDADVVISGEQIRGNLGDCVANAGDVDGDGLDDLLVAAPWHDGVGADAGRVYVFRGSQLDTDRAATEAWLIWDGQAANDFTGLALLPTGDVDGGGLPDLLIGAPQGASAGIGRTFLITTENLPSSGVLATRATRTWTAPGSADRAGETLAAGDYDGDGLIDVAIGGSQTDAVGANSGAVWVVPGWQMAAMTATASLSSAWTRITGEGSQDFLGERLASGDIDGDGVSDLLIGAPSATRPVADSGRAYVLSDFLASGDVPVATAGWIVSGLVRDDNLGRGLDLVPDLTGDGRDELLIGVPGQDGIGANAGEVLLFVSQSLPTGLLDRDRASHRFYGESGNDKAGRNVGVADVDGDGMKEIVVISPVQNRAGASAGRIYLVEQR